jgi:hypothetical protein
MIEKKRREKRSILYILMIIMGTNTTTTKKKKIKIQTLTNFLLFASKKRKEDNRALETSKEKKIYRSILINEKFYTFNTFIYMSIIIDIERHIYKKNPVSLIRCF